jgi:hypothetical protein
MLNVTLFSQIIQKIDRNIFSFLVKKHQSNKYSKGMDSWTHLITMLFPQFAKVHSLRDISNGLRSITGNLNHLGIKKAPSKSTISYQNEKRHSELFRDLYYALLQKLTKQAQFKQQKFKIKNKIHLLDSTTISLCLSLYDWAKYKTTKGAIKLHTLLDYDGHLPSFINITNGKVADNKGAEEIPIPAESVVVADRFYQDFSLLNKWDSNKAYFVVRCRENLQYTQLYEKELPENQHQHILIDEVIELKKDKTKNKYPKQLRRVAVYHEENHNVIEIITNNFSWTANTISELYKARWQIEIFFKEIKGLLKIKSFLGTSENAVMIQVWATMITILLLKYLKKIAKYDWCLSNLVSFIRLNIFVKIDLQKWLDKPFEEDVGNLLNNQTCLF